MTTSIASDHKPSTHSSVNHYKSEPTYGSRTSISSLSSNSHTIQRHIISTILPTPIPKTQDQTNSTAILRNTSRIMERIRANEEIIGKGIEFQYSDDNMPLYAFFAAMMHIEDIYFDLLQEAALLTTKFFGQLTTT
jgi:hypothetical protein